MATPTTKLSENIVRKFKPQVKIGVQVDTVDSGPSPSSWRDDEQKRIKAEVGALEKELVKVGGDLKAAGEKVRKGIEVKLKLKKLRLEEHRLKLADY